MAQQTQDISLPGTLMTIRPLGPVMGAEIIGLNVSRPLSGAATRRIQEAFNEYKVLCFRDQELTMEQLVSFSKIWGPLVEHTMPGQLRDDITEINIATNADPQGKPSGKHPDLTAMRWHTDRSWRIEPALGTILYGVEVPNTGGDTLFSNCTKAYDGLPQDTRRRVDPLKAIHSVEYSRRTGNGPPATEYELHNHPPTAHPLARKHPVTGRKALFCGCHAWMIEGWPEQQGREFLDQMQAFATRDEYIYRHKWRRHDLLMWDNRCTMHAATPYDTTKELRTMYRTVVAGGPTS